MEFELVNFEAAVQYFSPWDDFWHCYYSAPTDIVGVYTIFWDVIMIVWSFSAIPPFVFPDVIQTFS